MGHHSTMLTRREFLAAGAGCALFPTDLLHRDARLSYELESLRRLGVLDSMTWAADFCRRHPPSCGVGAVAGSLVAYRLGLTRIDPVKLGLYFERFANPERIDPPTIILAADFRDVGRLADTSVDAPVALSRNVEAWGLDLNSFLWLDSDAEWGESLVRDLRPRTLEDLAAILAITRRAPLTQGMTHEYLRRRLEDDPCRGVHPALRPVLQETFGVWVYQEQVMRAVERIAGFTAGQADHCRKALGKKIAQELRHWQSLFCEGARRRGINGAGDIFEEIAYNSGFTALQAHCLAWADLAMRAPAWKT